ncbi:hypothetical protein ACP4OV_026965 [Aristida adscensionis]
MAISSLELLLLSSLAFLILLFVCIKSLRPNNPSLPVYWPIVGILPSIIANIHNIHDYIISVLVASRGNYKVNVPLATSMQFFFTCDPANARQILSSNHPNYPKGKEFAEIFDIMRGGFFTIDGESSRQHRAKIQGILSNQRMLAFMTCCCRDKVREGLIPFLTHMANTKTPFDMQQLNTRYAFDVTATPVFGVDPWLLSLDMPPLHVTDAMDTVMEVAMFRHAMPVSLWKVMKHLRIGPERRLAMAQTVLRGFVTKMMETRKESRSVGDVVNIHSSYINDPNYDNDQVILATLITYLVAGRDTVSAGLSWFFYNMAKNPSILSRIRKELVPIASHKINSSNGNPDAMVIFEPEDTEGLVYLQAAVLETLRLYPPVPIERRNVVGNDRLPSGDEVRAGDTILISLYAMGRMESVWGNDCKEYRPERWLSDDGSKLQYVPSYKFLTFSSGPRMCLGKNIGLMQMKMAAANMLWNFDLEVLQGHVVEPKVSCILEMKNGLMMKVKRRLWNAAQWDTRKI